MTMHAYREVYLSKAQAVLGEAFDYAVNTYQISGEDFIKLFITSTISERLENGESKLLAGKSGIELAADILLETTGRELSLETPSPLGRSAEYWIGWAVAYYQWWSGKKFRTIFHVFSFADLKKMYYTLHEADISKFVEIADAQIKEALPETNLKRIRTIYGCSQSELARLSGVSLRSIQMYEQRNKDINKASSDAVYRMAKVLGCTMEELIEK